MKKVSSSHTKGETVILSDEPLDSAVLRACIDATGYEVKEIQSRNYEKKKGLLGLFG